MEWTFDRDQVVVLLSPHLDPSFENTGLVQTIVSTWTQFTSLVWVPRLLSWSVSTWGLLTGWTVVLGILDGWVLLDESLPFEPRVRYYECRLFKDLSVFNDFDRSLIYLLDLSRYVYFSDLIIIFWKVVCFHVLVCRSNYLRSFVNFLLVVRKSLRRFLYLLFVKDWVGHSGHSRTMFRCVAVTTEWPPLSVPTPDDPRVKGRVGCVTSPLRPDLVPDPVGRDRGGFSDRLGSEMTFYRGNWKGGRRESVGRVMECVSHPFLRRDTTRL